jgi:hypothetical protein
MHCFYGDVASDDGIVRAINNAHGAAAQFIKQLVAAGFGKCRHRAELVAARVQLKIVPDAKPLPFLLLQEESSRGFSARAETGEKPRTKPGSAQEAAPDAEVIPQLKLAFGMWGVNQTEVQGVPYR